MATGLSEALALLEQIDTGEAVREFYFLRGPASPEWSVHNREGGVWTVTKAPELADAILAQFGQVPDDDWSSMV